VHGKGAAIASPWANTEAMQLHLDQISRHVRPGAQAILIMDRARWHTTNVLAIPKKLYANPAALVFAGTEPGRKHLAIHSRQLALE
jgi:hypothetical protein